MIMIISFDINLEKDCLFPSNIFPIDLKCLFNCISYENISIIVKTSYRILQNQFCYLNLRIYNLFALKYHSKGLVRANGEFGPNI